TFRRAEARGWRRKCGAFPTPSARFCAAKRTSLTSFVGPDFCQSSGREETCDYTVCPGIGDSHMRYRRFGRLGWKVSEIGYGMWGMAGWTGSEDAESVESLQRAVDLGCNFFDTAWAYGDGHSEQLLGKTLRANKNNSLAGGPDKNLYVATKVPPKNRRWPSRPEYSLDDSYPPDYIFEYVDKSLKN